jgi:hypothetical protein
MIYRYQETLGQGCIGVLSAKHSFLTSAVTNSVFAFASRPCRLYVTPRFVVFHNVSVYLSPSTRFRPASTDNPRVSASASMFR